MTSLPSELGMPLEDVRSVIEAPDVRVRNETISAHLVPPAPVERYLPGGRRLDYHVQLGMPLARKLPRTRQKEDNRDGPLGTSALTPWITQFGWGQATVGVAAVFVGLGLAAVAKLVAEPASD
jgi:hypothetical protein